MNGHPKQGDPIGQAIAATDEPATVPMAGFQMTFGSSGRPFTLGIPADITPVEVMDLITWIAHPTQGMVPKLAAQRGPQLVRAASLAGLPKLGHD